MKTLEARTGMTIPEGYDPEISILRLTLDPVNVSYMLLEVADPLRLKVVLSFSMRSLTVSTPGCETSSTLIRV